MRNLAYRMHGFDDERNDDVLPRVRMVNLGRTVVLLIIAAVVAVAAIGLGIAAFVAGSDDPRVPVDVTIGGFDFLVGEFRPPTNLIISALLAMVAVAAGALAFEAAAAVRISRNPERDALVRMRPSIVLDPPPAARVSITILTPAHNEAASLPGTLEALQGQTRQPDRVIVVADNCTDDTVAIARARGVEVFETNGNTKRKGGALNQALAELLPTLGPTDAVMVMDADTRLGARYLETAAAALETNPRLDAIGGIFYGEPGHGLVGQFQRNEYTRYSGEIRRRRGRVFVLTGTASVFRAEALKAVAAARGVFLPGVPGDVYDTAALTEDNELTLAMKSLGLAMTSPAECTVTTEIMPTWRNLWRQRLRWQRGALENVAAYGVTSATARYWSQQVAIAYGTLSLTSALVLFLITLLAQTEWVWYPFWIGLGAVFLAERVITVWPGGWKARALGALLVPEILYDLFLQAVFVWSLVGITFGRRASWGHVQHAGAGA